jgi:hypothetical protein
MGRLLPSMVLNGPFTTLGNVVNGPFTTLRRDFRSPHGPKYSLKLPNPGTGSGATREVRNTRLPNSATNDTR